MFKIYQTTGYVWEQYTDDLGMGKVGVSHGRGMCQGSHMTAAVAAWGHADRSLYPGGMQTEVCTLTLLCAV